MKARLFILLVLATILVPGAALAKGKRGKTRDGQSLFKESCSGCHGLGGRGDGANAEKLNPPPADLTKIRSSEQDIAGVVRDGKGTCPKWRSSLSEDEIAAIAKWAHSLQR